MYSIVSYRGQSLNTPDLETVLEESKNRKLQASARIITTQSGPFRPRYSGLKSFEPRYFTLTCIPRSEPISQTKSLIQLFATPDLETYPLVLMDENGKRWVCNATCYDHEIDDGLSQIRLEVPDGKIFAEVPFSHSWVVTASRQSEIISIGGSYKVAPTFTLSPTSPKWSDSEGYWRFARWWNPKSARLYRYPFDLTNGGINTAALVNYTAVTNQINKVGGIGPTDDTLPIDTPVGGGLPTYGMGYVGTEQISWTGQSGGQLTGVVRGIGGTSAASHADNAVIALSKVQANGDDLLVYLDGSEYPRWLTGMNTTSTKIWTSITWKPGVSIVLASALGTGALTEITFKNNAATASALKKLPKSGYLLFDNEIIHYDVLNLAKKKVTGITRAQMGTSAASHAANTVAQWVEHEIVVTYGDQEAETPDYPDVLMPLLTMTSSTNTSWVASEFSSESVARPMEWTGAVLASTGGESMVYSGTQGDFADPATDLGMLAQVWQQAGVWKGETAKLEQRFYYPCGMTAITCTGEKYRKSTKWLSPRLQKSNDGINWTNVFIESSPGTAGSWGALDTHSGVSLGGTYKWLRYYMGGSLPAIPDNANGFSIKAQTLTIDPANIPQGSLSAEVVTAYKMRLTLTNALTGDTFEGVFPCKLNDVIEINCEARTITNLTSGASLLGGKDMPPKLHWFMFAPGDNAITLVDPGASGISMRVDGVELA